MYEKQIRIYIDPQVAKPFGFLRMVPCFDLVQDRFTYHYAGWYQSYCKDGTWLEHPYVHYEALEGSNQRLVMLFRRLWFQEEADKLYALMDRWLKGHPDRTLILVTDDAEEIKLSSVHVRNLTDSVDTVAFTNVYENWLYRMEGETGQRPWPFRSSSPLLQSLAYLETKVGTPVTTLQSLLQAPQSLLTYGLARRICAVSFARERYPLTAITHNVVERYVAPYLDDKAERELLVEAVASFANEYAHDTVEGVRHKLSAFVPRNEMEQSMLRLVDHSVI